MGYEKVALPSNAYYLSGVQFVKVGGEAATLNDLFPAADIPYGTEVLTLNEQGQYDSFTYLEEAYDAEIDDFVTGWGDGFEEIDTTGLAPGVGIWVKAPENCDLTQVGEVVSSDSVTINVPAGAYTMIANPFPAGFNPNKVVWSDNLPFETEILTLNEQGQYDSFTYLEEAYDAVLDDFVTGWGDGFEEIVAEDIATNGQGLWIKAPEAITLTISKSSAE
ncbi:MAG: hypothetical protein IJ678_01510 [Kiritimatiellae bacterium]|nr:hypothetical protein [Kiritimatiellia bacterium]